MKKIEKIVSLCKRRGFIFQDSEIYGGLASFYDYGPLGIEMKRNIKNLWWKDFVQKRKEVVGIDTTIIMKTDVWKASSHLKNFTDPLVECKKCHLRFKSDELNSNKCPECKGDLTNPRNFNLMFKTYIGPVEEEGSKVFLRPETAQGIFVNFKNVMETYRLKLPFGIAQIGKAFRNEITVGNFIFRMREFEQMELEWFCEKKEDSYWFDFWKKECMNWILKFGIKKENLRIYNHPKNDLAHYAKSTSDIEYKFEWGFSEIVGISNRQDYDLRRHSKYSGENFKIYPYVIEPSFGVDRLFLIFLYDSFKIIKGARTKTTKAVKEEEYLLKLHPKIAPIKAGVFPLVKKSGLVKIAKKIYEELLKEFNVQYDEVGSIGRRYRRQDEIGTPYCITVDFDSLQDKKVTIRDRDTMQQERINISKIKEYLLDKLCSQH